MGGRHRRRGPGFGGLDILVNNAGVFIAKGIEESTAADWERLCGVNLTGVFLGTQAALPALRERGAASPQGSAIVNLSSIAGVVGSAMAPLYSLTKGGVTTFTKSTALECARKGYRIRVNSIHPGIIDDEMGGQAIAARAEIRASAISRLPVRRPAPPIRSAASAPSPTSPTPLSSWPPTMPPS